MGLNGISDQNNNIHMFILQHVFLPRINHSLESFTSAWNNHPLRTEHNWSPKRLWLNGNIEMRSRSLSTVQFISQADPCFSVDDLEWFGYDPFTPISENDHFPQVVVEDIENISEDIVIEVQTVNPLQPSDCMGIDIYLNRLQRIQVLL